MADSKGQPSFAETLSETFLGIAVRIMAISFALLVAIENLELTILVGVGFLLWKALRAHRRQWGAPTAARMMRATLVYIAVLSGLYVVGISPVAAPVVGIGLWATVVYAVIIMLLDAGGPDETHERRGPSLRDFLQ